MEGIQIYELKRMDLRGATVIDGFPSVGLVSSIVANYLINALNLTQIGIMDSIYFPTVALVRDGQPMNPVRIYAGPKVDDRDQVVVFISEFQPPPNLIKAIAATVLDWAQDARCNLLVCPEGLIVDAREDEGERQVEVYGIGSTDKAMDMIRKNDITVFEEGVITGVAGVLLNEGRKRDFDVITLLSEAHPDYPDARAAARAIEVIDKLLLHTELDARPLYEEAPGSTDTLCKAPTEANSILDGTNCGTSHAIVSKWPETSRTRKWDGRSGRARYGRSWSAAWTSRVAPDWISATRAAAASSPTRSELLPLSARELAPRTVGPASAQRTRAPPCPTASTPRYTRSSILTSAMPWSRRIAACFMRFGMSSARFETCAMPRTEWIAGRET